jgi:hypothetical protein
MLSGCVRTMPHRQSAPAPLNQSATVRVAFQIGDATVRALVLQKGSAVPTMLNVHDDENTSVEAGQMNLAQFGGRLIELAHGGKRRVTFGLNGQQFSFDPNRVFSDAGIAATLKKDSSYSAAAHEAIKTFAEQYLKVFALDRQPVIIALHNTMDGTFSVKSYAPAGEDAAAVEEVHANPDRSPFDFFYVTDRRFFDYLKHRDFNVVLQDNARVPDDGSLSVYFSRKGIPYVNVEAQEGHLAEQIEMLKVTRAMLKDLAIPAKG